MRHGSKAEVAFGPFLFQSHFNQRSIIMAKRRIGKKTRSKKGGLKVHGGFKSMEHKAAGRKRSKKR